MIQKNMASNVIMIMDQTFELLVVIGIRFDIVLTNVIESIQDFYMSNYEYKSE